jgi:hypothetical protein
MKNKLIYILVIATALFQFACKKNNSSGPPMITNVRSVDTTLRDSLFSAAIPGNLIVIQGTNLGGLKAVFFNDTSAYFNPAYATNTNVIVYIPATAQTAATDPHVPSLIKLVTDHGTAMYNFKLYLPPPTIRSISFDNSGKVVYINGNNFKGIQKITFPIMGGADTARSYTVDKTGTLITVEIPTQGTIFKDSLRVIATFGTAAFSYPPPMTIASVSNENAITGDTITFTGTNFIGLAKVIFPGGIAANILNSISATQFTVIVPSGVNKTDSLSISGVLGTATAPQLFDSYISHPSPGYLCTFDVQYSSDNTGFVGWTGGYADGPAAATTYPNATGGVGVFSQSTPIAAAAAGTGFFSYNNAYAIQLNDVPWVSNTNMSISNYSLKFEIYTKVPWTAGAIWIAVGDWNSGWKSYTARYAPWSLPSANGKFDSKGWVTVTVPLTNFITGNEFYRSFYTITGNPAIKFTDYLNTGLAFLFGNDDPAHAIVANTVKLAIDNVRIVKGQ